MNNYFSQLLPKIPGFGRQDLATTYLQTHQDSTPKLKYIAIFNPSLIAANAESNDELMGQIVCFISTEDDKDLQQSSQVDQIRIVGLIQAVTGLAESFSEKSGEVNIIRASKSTILVKKLEGEYHIACSISLPENNVKEKAITQQMVKLLDQSYAFFKVLNTSFQTIVDNFNLEILKTLMKKHWGGFLRSYNSENFKYPPTVKWPNSLNYRGFLGFFDHPHQHGLYKRSSITLSYNMQVEIDRLLSKPNDDDTVPTGVIVSYFDKKVPKKYGLVYCNTAYDDSIGDNLVDKSQLIDVFNLMEYYNYHDKLDSDNFTRLSADDLFSSPPKMKDNINIDIAEEVPDTASIHTNESRIVTSANAALELLNPVNLTNNLVISPLNYTMNSVMNLTQAVQPRQISASWLSLPSYLKFGSDDENSIDEPEEQTEEDEGGYIVGLCHEETGYVIKRKLVYLETKVSAEKTEAREYSLVIFQKNNIYVTLIYDSSTRTLDEEQFYNYLSCEMIVPFIDELEMFISGGSVLESSVNSIPRSVNGLIIDGFENQLDTDFFFIVYNKSEGWVKSSLPYLPQPFNDMSEVNEVNRMQLNLRSAMFYLHDQLSDTFFLQNDNGQFFQYDCINDYFHKFSTNKINDWMFYYIRHESKYIIIIKNQNHKQRKRRAVKKLVVNDSSASTIASERVPIDKDPGFLANLGEDVRAWFETFTISGET